MLTYRDAFKRPEPVTVGPMSIASVMCMGEGFRWVPRVLGLSGNLQGSWGLRETGYFEMNSPGTHVGMGWHFIALDVMLVMY